MSARPMVGAMVSVGASVEAVREARGALNDILRSTNADAVKLAAVETLRYLCRVDNTTISNCNFTTGGGK